MPHDNLLAPVAPLRLTAGLLRRAATLGTVRYLLLCGVFACACCELAALAYDYQASGSLHVRYPLDAVFGGGDRSYRFSVRVRDCEWSVHLKPVAWANLEEAEIVPDYIAGASDGVLFYKVTSLESAAKKARAGVTANTAVALRGPGSTPYAVEDEIIALYYVFASHCYLRYVTNSRIYPFRGALGFNHQLTNDIRNQALWEAELAPPSLPKFIATTYRGELETDRGTFRSPYTNGVLTTPIFTNVSGLLIPMESYVQLIDVNVPGSTNGLPVVWKAFRITVDSADRYPSTASFVPELPSGASVQDITFWSNRPAINVSVRTKTNGWPDSAYLRSLYRAKVVAVPPHTSHLWRTRTGFLVFAVGTLGVLILGLRRKPRDIEQ